MIKLIILLCFTGLAVPADQPVIQVTTRPGVAAVVRIQLKSDQHPLAPGTVANRVTSRGEEPWLQRCPLEKSERKPRHD